MERIKQKITQASLTKTEQVIADYILENLSAVALYTITDLARDIGVSDTSVIRFVRTLGFDSFSEFKKYLSAQLLTQYASNSNSTDNLLESTADTKNEVAAAVMHQCLENMRKSCEQLSPRLMNQVVDLLTASQTKYICGFAATGCCAVHFARQLIYMLPHVRPLIWAESLSLEQLADISAADCLLLYSFPPYHALCTLVLDFARKSGAKIILITDKLTSPLACHADVVLPVAAAGVEGFGSYTASIFVSEVLLAAVSQRHPLDETLRANRIEDLLHLKKVINTLH